MNEERNQKEGYKIEEVKYDGPVQKDGSNPESGVFHRYEVVLRHRDVAVRGKLKLNLRIEERDIAKAIEDIKEMGKKFGINI